VGKRKRNIDDEPKVDVGQIMSVSLFLILLTFFILLNSIAVIDEIKARLAIGSLVGAFGSFTGGLSALKTGSSIKPPSAPMIDEEISIQQLLSSMKAEALPKDMITIKTWQDKEIISINEEVLFSKDRSMLKSTSFPLLDRLCDHIRKGDYPVEIVGHTDNRPAEEKGYTSNWELSTLMAIQVLRYFVEKRNLTAQRLTAYGCGSYRQIVSNDTKQLRARNRRIDIVLHFNMPAYLKRIYRKKQTGWFTYKRFDFKVF
jgi:chemotaxis protein MotB